MVEKKREQLVECQKQKFYCSPKINPQTFLPILAKCNILIKKFGVLVTPYLVPSPMAKNGKNWHRPLDSNLRQRHRGQL